MDLMKVGVDLISLEIFTKTIKKSPTMIDRVFHKSELNSSIESLCGTFAIKESVIKSIYGYGFALSLKDIFVVRTENGRPQVTFHSDFPKKINSEEFEIDISLSHHGDYVVAVTISRQK